MINLKKSLCVGIIIIFVSLSSGCASTRNTTKTETTVTYPSESQGNKGYLKTASGEQDNKKEVEKTETTTTIAHPDHPGVLSSTIHAIGYVLTLPFIVIGGLFKIFFGG